MIALPELLEHAATVLANDAKDDEETAVGLTLDPQFLIERAGERFGPKKAQAKLVLKDYSKYATMVAKAYEARPTLQGDATQAWRSAVAFVDRVFRQVETRLPVEFVDVDPYSSYEDMAQKVEQEGVLKIWNGASDKHPVWTPEQNWKFRAVHDYQSHIAGGHVFSLKGEFAAYNRHLKTFPRDAWPCLFTEIIGQTSYQVTHSQFPEQKVALLYGFDYVNIGDVDEQEYQRNFEG